MNRQETAAKAQKPAGKAKKGTARPIPRRTKKNPEKRIKCGPKPAGTEECEKFLDEIRKKNPFTAAFLGFLKHIGFDRSEIKAVYMAPKLAGKTPRKAPAEKTRKRGAK